jgi:hypothetical protein
MPDSRDNITRKNLPKGKDGEYLVIDSRTRRGLRWRKGIDRLITDMAPQLSGDLDANGHDITGVDDLTFSAGDGMVGTVQNQNIVDRTDVGSLADITALTFDAVTSPVAGIENQNLLDKTADETISGVYTHTDNIVMSDNSITGIDNLTFTDGQGEVAGIDNENLLDKTADETVSGTYTHTNDIVMSDNSITGIDTLQFTDTAGTVAGIQNQNLIDRTDADSVAGITALTFEAVTGTVAGVQNQNLVDKSAAETIAGAWTYGSAIAMDGNKITGLGNPTAAQDAATKLYADRLHDGFAHLTDTLPAVSHGTGLAAQTANPAGALYGWNHHYDDSFDETASEFEYVGNYPSSGTARFLVNWHHEQAFYSTMHQLMAFGKIEKKPSSGSYADVAGSLSFADRIHYGTYIILYLYRQAVSGSCILSLSAGDKFRFRYGTYNPGAGTYSVSNWASETGTNGVTLTITRLV